MPRTSVRVFIGGVGYRDLRDYSVGGAVIDRLAGVAWGPGQNVTVEDASYNPIALAQRLEDERDHPFDVAFLVASAARGRPAGTVTAYRWDSALPAPDRVQEAIVEAVTGSISVDNTLVVARHLGALPRDVIVIEVEPLVHAFGDDFSPPVRDAIDRVCALLQHLANRPELIRRLPETPLGGEGIRSPGERTVATSASHESETP